MVKNMDVRVWCELVWGWKTEEVGNLFRGCCPRPGER